MPQKGSIPTALGREPCSPCHTKGQRLHLDYPAPGPRPDYAEPLRVWWQGDRPDGCAPIDHELGSLLLPHAVLLPIPVLPLLLDQALQVQDSPASGSQM